jgi:hypothetical protein
LSRGQREGRRVRQRGRRNQVTAHGFVHSEGSTRVQTHATQVDRRVSAALLDEMRGPITSPVRRCGSRTRVTTQRVERTWSAAGERRARSGTSQAGDDPPRARCSISRSLTRAAWWIGKPCDAVSISTYRAPGCPRRAPARRTAARCGRAQR